MIEEISEEARKESKRIEKERKKLEFGSEYASSGSEDMNLSEEHSADLNVFSIRWKERI